MVEVLEEGAGEQQHAADHHVGSRVDLAVGEGPDQKIAAEHQVEDAGHQQLDQLGRVDDLAAEALAKDLLGNVVVAVADLGAVPELVGLVQAVHEDLAGVAADVGDAHHGQDGPVAAVVHSIGQRHYEHPLQ